MVRRHTIGIALLFILGLVLAACGQPTAVAPTAAPTTAVAPSAAPSTAASPAAASGFATIAQGRTTEGYQVLGAADAPVTLVMYSDFL